MLKVGLSGNIGSGKSVVVRIFDVIGIPIYHADDNAKNMLEFPEVVEKIKERFGSGIIDKQGKVSRKNLAQIVFSDNKKLVVLNSIIHPLVIADFEKWIHEQKICPYVVMESAILYETGYSALFDKIIIVSAPEKIRINRVMKRDGVTKDDVLKRIKNQLPEENQMSKADYTIVNDGKTLVVPQVLEIHRLLCSI
ncbi:MAG: dephospho-CoA kinase [Bacteroidales bacterium]